MVTTRFAPSPTGHLHIGGARTAIISWLIAEKLDGNFVLRIEDTDTIRSKPEYTESILSSLKWLGINHSNDLVYQSQRYSRYQEVAQELLDKGLAYRCYSTNEELNLQREEYKKNHGHDGWKYDRKWREVTTIQGNNPYTIRLKVPLDGTVSWNDLTSGLIEIPNKQLDDFIILRSDGSPTYNFCVVVDDTDMDVSHVIRGQDHISNTPKQIHIYNALNKSVPVFGHIPLILNIDGSKQSKSSGATSVNYYKSLGITKEALVNYLLLISCNDIDKEIFTKEEFVEMFDLNKLGNTPIKFDLDKLMWINQQHLKSMSDDEFTSIILDKLNQQHDKTSWTFSDINSRSWSQLKAGVIERSKTSEDFLSFVLPVLNWNPIALANYPINEGVSDLLKLDTFNAQNIHDSLKATATRLNIKFGELVKPFRNEVFPGSTIPLADMIEFIGKMDIEYCFVNRTSLKIK